MPQPQSWGEDYSLHTPPSVVGEFARREFAFRLSSTANILLRINKMVLTRAKNPQLPRRFGYAIRTSETAGTPKISL